ncbi:MAG TPA: cytochrome c, partial [Crenalkalicoccus sp.]|nr:cytochrome c [Crenalkalicoccus sp.]
MTFGTSLRTGLLAGLLAAPAAAQPAPGSLGAVTGAPGATPAARGLYLTEAADCMPCHTAPGGRPYAGGRVVQTPFGTVVSPNITPDRATGIGTWTPAEFWNAVHDGVGRNGEDLYPVMPFTSYTGMTREDADAIFAYLRTVPAVDAPDQPNGLYFPFSIRATLGVWRELFFQPGVFRPDPARSPEWNRGAYLVTALGHCGECHTPRNLLGATEPSAALQGAVVAGWFAPNLTPDLRQGLGGWSVAQIADWLRTGASRTKGTVFGPMSEVQHDSLARLTDADLHAIATYLHDEPSPALQAASAPAARRSEADRAAAALYAANCAGCHRPGGRGSPGVIPPLAGNQAVTAAAPNDVIEVLLNGLPAQGSYGAMPRFAAALDDRQIAALANYVRTAWGNQGTANATPGLVASLRAGAATGLAGTEAARALCPAINPLGQGPGQDVLGQGAAALMRGADSGDLLNRTDLLLRTLRRNNPG